MKKYLSIIFLSLFCNYLNGQTVAVKNNQEIEKNDVTKAQSDLIFEKVKVFPDKTQLSIAFIKDGKPRFYGIEKENGIIRSVENHRDVFEIGSISKVFTATLLTGLVIDKKLELDNNINDYLDYPLKNDQKITFKELANHTSGLPRLPTNLNLALADPDNPYKGYDENKLREYLTENLELSKRAEKKSEYSNLGVGLLGYTLSQIENKGYQDLLEDRVFSKYKMTNSTTNKNDINTKLVKGLNPYGEETSNWDLDILVGAGGILSTAEDLSKFAIAQFNDSNSELSMTRAKTFEVVENIDIGLGWAIIKKESGNDWHWHNGGTGGYTSSMTIDTMNRNGVVILSNVSAFSQHMGNIDQLCFELIETLEGN